ncbi:MAG: hypothetical protein JSS72_13160 [Armatimonadetes bacterium]|nr:hypothetical protein [Armatimonadota bacterium]
MNVSGSQAVNTALNAVEKTDNAHAALQLLLLKKALEMRQEEASQIQNSATGKGSVLDIRV